MEYNLIVCFLIIYVSPITKTQYQGYYNGAMMGEAIYSSGYSPPGYGPPGYSNRPYGSSGGMLPYAEEYEYEDPEECSCKCNKCYKPKRCCVKACMTCSQGNVVVVPYPYPLIVIPPTTSTTTTTTTTPSPRDYAREMNNLLALNDINPGMPQNRNADNRYNMMTSLRKTKSNWLPRYGIVPIPDQLAESLMTQMRSMKGLQTKRDSE